MSSILPYNDFFRKSVLDINELINSLMSIKPLPLWINPINTKFYQFPGYKVGQIVLTISDKNLVIEYLEPFIKKIADYIGMDYSVFKERNNWEMSNEFFNIFIYGGNILPHLKIQPLTILSDSIYGFDIYVSTQGNDENLNYDMPGMSDAWLNLRTPAPETVELMIGNIIEQVENSSILDTIFDIRIQNHLNTHHFKASKDNIFDVEIELNNYLDDLEELYSSRTNATSDVLRMPLKQNKINIGQCILLGSTTNEYIASGIINLDTVDINEPIIFPFIPNEELDIVIPTILEFNGEYIEGDALLNDTVEIEPNLHALCINSLYTLKQNSIVYKHTHIGMPLSISSNFAGFATSDYVVSCTAIGKTRRVDKTEIQCMPIEEIKRTSQYIVFKINPKYVWQTTALNITVSGIKFG